jgi:hypothetical protein
MIKRPERRNRILEHMLAYRARLFEGDTPATIERRFMLSAPDSSTRCRASGEPEAHCERKCSKGWLSRRVPPSARIQRVLRPLNQHENVIVEGGRDDVATDATGGLDSATAKAAVSPTA